MKLARVAAWVAAMLELGCSSPAVSQCFSNADCAPGLSCSADGQCTGDASSTSTGSGTCAPRAGITSRNSTCGMFPAMMCGQTGDGFQCCCSPSSQWQCITGTPRNNITDCDSECIPLGATLCGSLPDGSVAYCDASSTCVPGGNYGCCPAGTSCSGICP